MTPVVAGKIASKAIPLALGAARELYKNKKQLQYFINQRGSKVKMGEFAGAPIEMFGDKACIQFGDDGKDVLLLTSDNIQSYTYVKKKKRVAVAKVHTYYYYNITFKDGSESYVRMRSKYAQAMERYT